MRIIQLLTDKIEDEMKDACDYAKLALEYHIESPEVADLFYRLSKDEMTHMDMLHKSVANIITDYRRTSGEPPAAMQAVYDFLHKRYIEKAERITNLQNMYKK